jgi:transposase
MKLMLSKYKIPEVRKVSVDEVYARKFSKYPMESKNNRYFTVVTDIETRKVIWVSEGRSKAALDQFFILVGKQACERIEVVAMDQFDGYKASVKDHCPNAVVVWDRFHLVKSFEDLLNEERLTLHQRTDKQMPDKKFTRSKYKYIFMKKASRRSHKEEQHIKYVMRQNSSFYLLELIKERFLTMFDEPDHIEARRVWDELGGWIKESRFILLQRWWEQLDRGWDTVKNYFKYRVTTSISEGINNVIKSIKRRAFGFKNMEYFRLKIMQVCGYLNSRFIPSQDQLLTQI